MAYPFFYIEEFEPSAKNLVLDENNSKHAVQVLRMQNGDHLNLTDGKGHLITAIITNNHKRHCEVALVDLVVTPTPRRRVHIGLSLLKNASRFEWFLEKATEIGVFSITPLLCDRTERTHYRMDRLKGILVSALLQSQQVWIPELSEPLKLENLNHPPFSNGLRFIAHCEDTGKKEFSDFPLNQYEDLSILIGPEGDFTPAEIEKAIASGYQPVSLGDNRLRSETAGVVAATLLKLSGS